jgi:hypothetical protein
MKSPLFFSDAYHSIEQKVMDTLNSSPEFLSVRTAKSPRAVGDSVQELLGEHFGEIIRDFSDEFSSTFASRSMADLAFKDKNGCYHIVDIKTHRTDTKFNMPNLTSVERLTRFYEDDTNYFTLLMISYHLEETKLVVTHVHFVPIEFIGWDCLTLGALGWGQIQIANSNRITIRPQYSRKSWMLELCDELLEFYPREIAKIDKRMEHFRRIRAFWDMKQT